MKIAVGSDHAGFPLKAALVDHLRAQGHDVLDLGTGTAEQPVDYPDIAHAVSLKVVNGDVKRGIVVCGSGVGASIAANKVPGIYAAMCHDTYSAHQGVEHDNMNVLCLGNRVIGAALAYELADAFLSARFEVDQERHVRRHNKVKAIEQNRDGF
ncbi:MAG: ribose 5-phosphate isomerase B [Anaerolineae bacterium]|jgi:ribose 5-phosphate isomerase B|nr:ribose 5-phosphate isomerase B [Anaerolineae bacterium]